MHIKLFFRILKDKFKKNKYDIKSFDFYFNEKDLYVFHCLDFSNPDCALPGEEIIYNSKINTLRFCHYIWLLETKRYEGCSEEDASNLLKKLKDYYYDPKLPKF